jgi:hypothetical protein
MHELNKTSIKEKPLLLQSLSRLKSLTNSTMKNKEIFLWEEEISI